MRGWAVLVIIKHEVLTDSQEVKTDEVWICFLRRRDTLHVLFDTSLRGAP